MNRCLWSWEGVVAIWREEPSFRFWSFLNACSAALAFWLPLSAEGRALIVALGVLVLAAEALNTGVEAAIDRSGMELNPLGEIRQRCCQRRGCPCGYFRWHCLGHFNHRAVLVRLDADQRSYSRSAQDKLHNT